MSVTVLILSKTHMSNAACVGGLDLSTNKFIRLLDVNGHNQPVDSNFEIGEIWTIEYTKRYSTKAPHTEDVLVSKGNYVEDQSDLASFIKNSGVTIWRGSPEKLFNGLLTFTGPGSGHVSCNNEIPNQSVGFWIPDRDLIRNDYNSKVRFCYRTMPNSYVGQKCLPYVGYADSIEKVSSGTLCRVSLARWWKQDENTEERCYLQLSGWYL